MEIIRNKPRSNKQSRYWALIPLASSIWFFYWSLAGKESDKFSCMWVGITFLIFAATRWFAPFPMTGINSVSIGGSELAVEYLGGGVLTIPRDQIKSIESQEKGVCIHFYLEGSLRAHVLPKKFFDQDSWEKVQQLESML